MMNELNDCRFESTIFFYRRHQELAGEACSDPAEMCRENGVKGG